MRLWSLHPRYLDAKGLVALWRETLLAQAVLAGRTRGYRGHPQLIRFRAHSDPAAAVAAYLWSVWGEAESRGYCFDARRIDRPRGTVEPMEVTRGQLRYEGEHLRRKLIERDPGRLTLLEGVLEPHPLFTVVEGEVESWERP